MARIRKEIVLTRREEMKIFQTLEEAGDFIGITRERVRQLAKVKGNAATHKKSGWKVQYGEDVVSDQTKFERLVDEAMEDEQIIYKDKLYKHYYGWFFVASDASYLELIKNRGEVVYKAPTFGYRARLRQDYLYRIVAKLFIPNPKNLPTVDHINGLDAGHGVDNLRWATSKENSNGFRVEMEQIRSRYKIVETGQIFNTQKELAKFLDTQQSFISAVLNPNRKGRTVCGFHIERVEL